MSDAPHPLRFEDFELDEGNARLTRAGRVIALPPKAFALLCELSRHPGRLASKDALLDAVWGHRHVSESVLKTTVGQVRAALADDAEKPRYVETVARRGYRFIARIGAQTPQAGADTTSSASALPAIVGRTAALGRLHESWGRAKQGQRQLVWIAGDAGIGKTTLIDRFIAETGAETVAHGQCVEQFGAGEPYMPVLEALKILCRRHSDLVATLRQVAPTWLVQLPWLVADAERAALHAQLAGATQERMVREFWELMEQHTQTAPLLLVTEDLHWSDHGTLRLMDHFARRRGSMRLLWIASFRLTQVIAEEHPLQQLRQELQMHRLCEEILLDPFSEAELAEYVEVRAPAVAASESFIKRLHAHTDGLPLFVLNVLDSLLAAEVKRLPGDRSEPGALPIPDNLTGAIEKHIGKLPDRVRAMLEAASVCGVEFSAGLIADVTEVPVHDVVASCSDLVRQKYWLREVGVVDLPGGALDVQFAFRHVLYKHAFYQRIALSQRVALHRRVARTMEGRRARGVPIAYAELGSHQELGREYASALASYAEAAKSALAHFAPREAIDLTGHALALLQRCPDGPERQEVELSLLAHRGIASSHLLGVSSPESVEAFERVRHLCDVLPQTPARALLLNGLGWGFYTRGEYADALAMSQRVHDVAERFDDRTLFATACNLIAVTLGTQGKFTQSREWGQKGIAACELLGERLQMPMFLIDPEVSLQANIALPLAQLGYADQARSRMAQALMRAQRLGQPMARMLALWCACLLYVRLDDPEKVNEYAAELSDFVTAADLRQGLGPSLWFRGWVAARRGDGPQAHAKIMEGYACHERLGMYGGCTEVLGYAAEALILEERWSEAQARIDAALALADRLGEGAVLPELLILHARIEDGLGHGEAACRALERALAVARAEHALGCELKALIALAQRRDRTAADLNALANAYSRLSEGLDTRTGVLARALLDG
jgi:DNA-binding winged helix-turn-helix (wHTH) protein/tetratricopeptide (TPR) repeat protein